MEKIDQAFADKWVKPFYRKIGLRSDSHEKLAEAYAKIYQELSEEIIGTLLADSNWRATVTGAWFAGVAPWPEFSRALLKSQRKNGTVKQPFWDL